MRIKFVGTKHAFWLLLCSFTFKAAAAQSEVITIEEFLHKVMSSVSIAEAFSYEFGDEIKGSKCGERYFAVKTATDIYIFDAGGRIQTFSAKTSPFLIKDFIDDPDRLFVSMKDEDGNYVRGIFEMDGTPVKTFSIPNIYSSPGGEFFYTPCSMLGTQPIIIYDYDGEMLFLIPITFECQVTATSDSRLIVLHHKSLSLWDVNVMGKIWESNIPRDDYYTDSAFKIDHSVKNDIIVVRDVLGLHCFDFQGNFLWAQEGLGNNKSINMVGVSEENGNVVITANEGISIKINIFSRDGDLLSEPEIPLGLDCLFLSNVTHFTAEVFPNFILLPFMASAGGDRTRVTGILYYDDSEWIAGVIEGSWYFLGSSNDEHTLIGLRKKTRELSAFSINY